jgi:hypothetical protein
MRAPTRLHIDEVWVVQIEAIPVLAAQAIVRRTEQG